MAAQNAGEMTIDGMLTRAGYVAPEAQKAARAALEQAGLTNARKKNIAAAKEEPVRKALAAALLPVCGEECRTLAAGSRGRRQTVVVRADACEVCAGENNRRAAVACTQALRRAGIRRLLIVGGTVVLYQEILQLFGDGFSIEWVDGTRKGHNTKDAQGNMGRAQLMVIWGGSTPLRHAVSNLYETKDRPPDLRVVRPSRRSIGALCSEVVRHLAG